MTRSTRRRPAARGAAEAAPVEIGAWLHIGESGVVTVYTGKVEVGQNARTSLTQAVAEELHAPPSSVNIDDGRHRPDAVRHRHGRQHDHAAHVAADPRARRRRLARCCSIWRRRSGRWIATPSQSPTARCRAAAHSAGFGELARGEKWTRTIPASVPLAAAAEWKTAGKSHAQGQRPGDRHRRAQIHVRPEAPGHAARQDALPAAIRRDAGLPGRFGGGSHAGSESGARGQLRGGGRAGAGDGRQSAWPHSRRNGSR